MYSKVDRERQVQSLIDAAENDLQRSGNLTRDALESLGVKGTVEMRIVVREGDRTFKRTIIASFTDEGISTKTKRVDSEFRPLMLHAGIRSALSYVLTVGLIGSGMFGSLLLSMGFAGLLFSGALLTRSKPQQRQVASIES